MNRSTFEKNLHMKLIKQICKDADIDPDELVSEYR